MNSANATEQSNYSQWQSTANNLLAQVNSATTDSTTYYNCSPSPYAAGAMNGYESNLLGAAQALVQAEQAREQALVNQNSTNVNSTQTQQQLAQVNQQLADLMAQQAAAPNAAEQQSLQSQINQLQAQQTQLQNQQVSDATAQAAATASYNSALSTTLSAQSTYVQNYNALTSAFANLQYTECATTAGQKAKVTSPLTITVNDSSAITGVTQALFGNLSTETSSGNPSSVLFNWGNFSGSYFNWQSAVLNQQQAQSQLSQAQTKLTAANNAVSSLQSVASGVPPSSSTAYQICQNAASILNAVDQRGAIP